MQRPNREGSHTALGWKSRSSMGAEETSRRDRRGLRVDAAFLNQLGGGVTFETSASIALPAGHKQSAKRLQQFLVGFSGPRNIMQTRAHQHGNITRDREKRQINISGVIKPQNRGVFPTVLD